MSDKEYALVAAATIGLVYANLMGPHRLVRQFAPDGDFILWRVVPKPGFLKPSYAAMSSPQSPGFSRMNRRMSSTHPWSARSTTSIPWLRSQ